MSSNKMFQISAVLIMLFSLTVSGQEIREVDGRYHFTISKEFDVEPGGMLEVDGVNGHVIISSWDKNQVAITDQIRLDVFTKTEAKEVAERIEDGYSSLSNTVTIQGRGHYDWMRRELEIKLPRSFDADVHTTRGNIVVSHVDGNIDLKTSGGNIELLDIGGDLQIKTSGGNLILDDIRASVEGKTSGGNIELNNIQEMVDLKTSGGNIRAVNVAKDAHLRTSGGRITLRNMGGNVNARTSGGNIKADDCKGEVDLHTSGGDVVARNIGSRLDIKTSGGDVFARNVAGTVLAQTSGGDVELEDIRGAVRAKTSAGDVEVEITLKDFSKDHRIHLKTNTGTIKLVLPAKFPATISAEIHDSGGRWDRHEIYSDFPLSQEGSSSRRVVRRSGDINGGGDEVILDASHGDIYIRKAK